MIDGWYEAINNPSRMVSKAFPAGSESQALREIADWLDQNDDFTFINLHNQPSSRDAETSTVELTVVEDIGKDR